MIRLSVYRALALILLSGLVMSLMGSVLPIGDSLAVFRQPMAVLLLGLLALRMRPFWRWIGIIPLVALALWFIWQPVAVPEAGSQIAPKKGAYRLYQKNLLYRNKSSELIAAEILASGADFVTLQEVFRHNQAVLDLLAETYPHRLVCDFAGVGAVAVLSRFTRGSAADECFEGDGIAAMNVATPDGKIWVASLHLHWPWPFRQTEQVESIVESVAVLEGQFVVGGDANMVPASHVVARLNDAFGTKIVQNRMPTFFAKGIWGLTIDHVFLPVRANALIRRPRLGSDHLGVVVDFDLSNSH